MPRSGRVVPRSATLLAAAAIGIVAVIALIRLAGPASGPDRVTIPDIPAPPPLPPLALRPVTDPVRIIIRDVDVTDRSGTRIQAPRVEVVLSLGADPRVHVRRMTVERPIITARAAAASAVGARADPRAAGRTRLGALFLALDIPRIAVDTLVIRGARTRRHAAAGSPAGAWAYDLRPVNIRLTKVTLGGGLPERADIRIDLRGDYAGSSVTVRSLSATATRTGDRLAFRATGELDASRGSVVGVIDRSGKADVRVVADSIAFSELRPLFDAMPDSGWARVDGRIMRSTDGLELDLDRALLVTPGSRLELSGLLRLGDAPRASDFVARSSGLELAELQRFGVDVPLTGRLSGRIRADGPGRAIQVEGEVGLEHRGQVSRIAAVGTVDAVEPAVDLRVTAPMLALPGAVGAAPDGGAFAGHSTAQATLRISGPLDSLAATGGVALLAGEPTRAEAADMGGVEGRRPAVAALPAPPDPADGEPRRMYAVSARRPVVGTIDIRLIGLLGERRRVRGDLAVAADPAVLGLRDGPALEARLSGHARLESGGRLDASLRADSLPLRLVPVPSAISDLHGRASADLRLTGTVDAPLVEGVVRLDGGAMVGDRGVSFAGGGGLVALESGRARFDGLALRVGDGSLRLDGEIVPGPVAGIRIRGGDAEAPRLVDLTLTAEAVPVLRDELARVDASGRLHVRGTMDEPLVTGRVVPAGWVREDFFASSPGLDLDDPPHAELAARAPWPETGHLRSAGRARLAGGDGARPSLPGLESLSAELVVAMTHALRIIDEDSELRGTGDILIRMDDGMETAGVVALEEGSYSQFGTRFRVYGGAFAFDGPGLMPRIALRSDYDDEAPLVGDDQAPPRPGRFPPVQFFGYGSADGGRPMERVTRYTLIPATQMELARHVLLHTEATPVGGWRNTHVWRPDAGDDLFGQRATAQGATLAASYVADRLYDHIALDRAYFRTSVVTVGDEYPGRSVVTPMVHGAAILTRGLELRVAQPLVGVAPGVAAVYRRAGFRLEAFTGPRFRPATPLGAGIPGYDAPRRTGVAVRWVSEY